MTTTQTTQEREPWELDFADYIESLGGVYDPFPAAVEFIYSLDWCKSISEALFSGHRPPAERVAEYLRRYDHLKAYLPPEIAADYPTVPNPYLPTAQQATRVLEVYKNGQTNPVPFVRYVRSALDIARLQKHWQSRQGFWCRVREA